MMISIIAALKPVLINSLPQNSFESEYNPNNDNAFIANPDSLHINDGNPEDTLTPNNIGSGASLATNADPMGLNGGEVTIAANTEDTVADCKSETGQENGALSGRSTNIPGSCGVRAAPQPDAVDNSPTEGSERKAATCVEPWIIHVCGVGPTSLSGRVDIPHWPNHRAWIKNVFRTCQLPHFLP